MKSIAVIVSTLFALILFGCGASQKEVNTPPSANDPQGFVTSIENTPGDSAPKLDIAIGNVIPPTECPPEFREFADWTATKLSHEKGLLRGIITGRYKGRDLRVGLVYYGNRAWQYVYDPIILNSDMRAVFGFWLESDLLENNDQAVKDNYPTFQVPEKEDKKFVEVVYRHMKYSGLVDDLEISWETSLGEILEKPSE